MPDLLIRHAELLNKGISKFEIYYSRCHGYECCADAKELVVQDNSGTSGMAESISYSKTNVIFTAHAYF
jgi:hypothetical protein